MRALVQRVQSASVTVDSEISGQIGPGLLVLVCAMQDDTDDLADWLAQKIAKLRIFQDDAGKMNRSLLDIGGSALVVSSSPLPPTPRAIALAFPAPHRPNAAAISTKNSPPPSTHPASRLQTAFSVPT